MGTRLIRMLLAERRAANYRAEVTCSAAQLVEHGDAGMQPLLAVSCSFYAALAELLGRQTPIRQVRACSLA